LLADVLLPDGDGVALASALVERHPGLRVVLMTGSDAVEVDWPVLTKPFDFERLVSVVLAR
jgi:DNA-binding NtrC family response regulator